jgi:hypothetical protein
LTLIIGGLFGGVMFQVSDRRLTLSTSHKDEVWDTDSNKSLVASLGTSMLFIGYSGDAFVKLRLGSAVMYAPTDSWLAAVCAGVPLHASTTVLDRTPRLERVRAEDIVTRIRYDMARYVATLSADERTRFRLYVQLIGITMCRNGRPRATLHRFSVTPDQPSEVLWTTTRTRSWWAAGPHRAAPVPSLVFSPQLGSSTIASIIPRVAPTASIEEFRHGLVGMVQKMADINPKVGRDVLALEYDPRSNPSNVEVRHFPGVGVRSAFDERVGDVQVLAPGFRSPWYLSKFGSMEPRDLTSLRMSVGTRELGEDPVGLEVNPSVARGLPFAMGARSLRRRSYDP